MTHLLPHTAPNDMRAISRSLPYPPAAPDDHCSIDDVKLLYYNSKRHDILKTLRF